MTDKEVFDLLGRLKDMADKAQEEAKTYPEYSPGWQYLIGQHVALHQAIIEILKRTG